MNLIDPITLTIFQRRFEAITEEMSHVLRKTAYSPNIKERADFSCAIFDNCGNIIAQAEAIPVHLGSMPFVAKPILKMFKNLKEGDAIVTNSPRSKFGGTHLPDITLLSPVFLKNKLKYIVANRAHHADVGGSTPGSLPAKSSEIYQEGLIIPPVKLYNEGIENDAIMSIIMENVRTPYERRGDLRAQYSSLQLGMKRIHELVNIEPNWNFDNIQSSLINQSRIATIKRIQQLPKNKVSFTDYMDDDGFQNRVKITCSIEIANDQIIFDFTGSSSQTQGNVNAPLSVTTSACYYVVRLLLGTSIPRNSGTFAPIVVIAPENTVVNPAAHHATSSANTETSTRIVDVVLGALSKLIDVPAASQGTMNNLIIGGIHNGNYWSIYETIGGGTGAGPNGHGVSAIQSHMTNTENTPIEALELSYPLLITEYSIRQNSGGKGQFNGGNGIVREIKLLDNATINIQSDRRNSVPYGLKGGQPGSPGKNIIKLPSDEDTTPDYNKSRVYVQNAPSGTIIRIETPGGGGWGARSK